LKFESAPCRTKARGIRTDCLAYTPAMPREEKPYRETEIKLRVASLPELLAKLKTIGARPLGRVLERNTVFDTDASDLRQRGRLLRLRTEAPASSLFAPAGRAKTILTAKSPLPLESRAKRRKALAKYKVAVEREVQVREPVPSVPPSERKLRDRGWAFALGVLGLRVGFRYEKYRTTFAVRGKSKELHVTLDETPVGNFLELEGTPRLIDQVARALNFGPEDYVRSTYFEIYAMQQRRRGRPVRNMVFRD
jgi:adenylate cyclase, class 2